MSEALRLADEIMDNMSDEHWNQLHADAAAELRRLHAALAEPEQKAKPITAAEMSTWVKDTWEKCQAEAWQEPVGHADLGINNIYIFSALEPRVVPAGRTPLYTAPTPRRPQTTHWEGCEAVHPECKTEHGVKDLSNYEFKTYKMGGTQLEAGFYSTDELRDLVKAFDKMNAATERSMRRMK